MLASDEFRVFDLLPAVDFGDTETAIQGRTRVLPLPTSVGYETLSYVWGNAPEKEIIQVDGHDVDITTTLATALRRLRLSDQPRTLWIDQLCIHQDDDTEKVTQIPLMRQIYSSTNRALIWMGEIRPGVALADAISAFELMTYKYDTGDEAEAERFEMPACMTSAEAMVAPMKALRSIGTGENPWWERIWTLQEAVLPPKALMLWGPLSISWDVLARPGRRHDTPLVVRMFSPHTTELNSIISQVIGLELARNRSESPMQLAFRWGFRKATHPLDKVYGLLGLFPPGTLRRVGKPDYQLPAATVYAMFTVDMIEYEKDLHPISLWNANHFPHSTPDMPSWAFDLSNPGREFVDLPVKISPVCSPGDDNMAWYLMHNYGCYNASANSEIDWSVFSYDASNGHLEMTGQFVDTIQTVGPCLESKDPSTKNVVHSEVIDHIELWRQLVEQIYLSRQWPDDNRSYKTWPNSFWRGLIGNVVGEDLVPKRWANDEDIAAVQHFVRTGERALICQEIFATMTYRTVAVTKSGSLAFCPQHTREGDQIWLLHGGRVPFVLRPQDEEDPRDSRFRFIGPAYVDGIMNGEVLDDANREKLTLV